MKKLLYREKRLYWHVNFTLALSLILVNIVYIMLFLMQDILASSLKMLNTTD